METSIQVLLNTIKAQSEHIQELYSLNESLENDNAEYEVENADLNDRLAISNQLLTVVQAELKLANMLIERISD